MFETYFNMIWKSQLTNLLTFLCDDQTSKNRLDIKTNIFLKFVVLLSFDYSHKVSLWVEGASLNVMDDTAVRE